MASQDTRPRTPIALAALGAACAAGVALLGLIALGTVFGQRLDDAGRGTGPVWGVSRGSWTASRSLLDLMAPVPAALAALAIVAIALARRRARLAAAAAVVLLGANVTTQLIKHAVDRPNLLRGGIDPGSFPSGHATAAMSLAMALVLVLPPSLRWAGAVAGCGWAAAIGIAILTLDWHRPSEVLAGFLMATAWTATTMAVLTWLGPADRRRGGAGARAGVALAGLVALGGAAAAVAVARHIELTGGLGAGEGFAAAVTLCTLGCAALGALTTALVQRATARGTG